MGEARDTTNGNAGKGKWVSRLRLRGGADGADRDISATAPDRRHWTPISRGLDTVGDKWTLLILAELRTGSLRLAQLQERLPGITQDSLDRHLRGMRASGLISRRALKARPRIEYELTASGRELLCVVEELSRWAMRRAWSAPRGGEVAEPRLLMRHLPLLLESGRLPSGVVELVIEHPERPVRHVVNLHRGTVSLIEDDLGAVMPWTRIVGNDGAWIAAFGPHRSSDGLRISGDVDLAGALLGALPPCS
jgi:DNA-binding HxlR family transcriptional regulator